VARDMFKMGTESREGIRYRVNFEDGTCSCSDFKHRGETCKHFYKICLERAIA
jgi:hypothetical protein